MVEESPRTASQPDGAIYNNNYKNEIATKQTHFSTQENSSQANDDR